MKEVIPANSSEKKRLRIEAREESSRLHVWIEALFLLVVFLLYLWTLAPFIYWRDAPEFVDAVATLGIAHPAGFPTYSLMGRLTCLLPFGSVPFRMNLFSMLCAVGAIWVFIRTSKRLLEESGSGEVEAGLISVGSAGIVALGYPFWSSSLSAEVYTLHLLFMAVVIHFAVLWYFSNDDRYIYVCAFVYGLSAGNHASVCLILPGLLIFFCARNREDTIRKFILTGVFFIIGFSVYLYLPIRSGAFPEMDWGEPRTLWKMFSHITDRKDAELHSVFTTGGYWGLGPALLMQGKKIIREITFLGAPLALLGLFWNIRRFPLVLVLLGFIFLPQGVFFIHWIWGGIHLQLFLVLGLWMTMGIRQLFEWGESSKFRRLRPWKIVTPVVISVLIMQTALNYPGVNLSDDRRVEYSFRETYMSMEPDALVITAYLWPHYRTYQDVMRLREDITVLLSSNFISPDYFMRATSGRYPRIPVPEGDYRRGDSGRQFMFKLLTMNMDQGRPMYFEIFRRFLNEFYRQVLPDNGFLFRFTRRPVDRLDPELIHRYILSLRDRLLKEVETGGLMREKEVYHYYIWFLIAIVEYLELHDDWGNVLRMLDFIEKFLGPGGLDALWPWERAVVDSYIATAFIKTGEYDKAKRLLEDLASRCSYCYSAYRNLAWLYYREGGFQKAKYWLLKSKAGDSPDSDYLELLGDIEAGRGKPLGAVETYRNALKIVTDPDRKKILEDKINRLLLPGTSK